MYPEQRTTPYHNALTQNYPSPVRTRSPGKNQLVNESVVKREELLAVERNRVSRNVAASGTGKYGQ